MHITYNKINKLLHFENAYYCALKVFFFLKIKIYTSLNHSPHCIILHVTKSFKKLHTHVIEIY